MVDQVSKVNSSDKNKIIEEEDEELAYEKIADEFGIEPVRIIWRPTNMKFKKMELDSEIQVAELDFQYNGKKLSILLVHLMEKCHGDMIMKIRK